MFFNSFLVTGSAVFQIFLLGVIGYFLIKKNFLGNACLDSLSRLALDITLPLLIFCQLIREFSFSLYPNWWIFPILSIAVNISGLLAGLLFCGFFKQAEYRLQFLSTVTFQNSGYLPLALIAALLPAAKAGVMFIYLFLFLLGFNLVTFSFGVYMLTFAPAKKFQWASLFSPPVVVTLASLVIIFFGWNKFIPQAVLKPLRMLGDCTLPLSMLVVGGNLADIHLGRLDKKGLFFMSLAKLFILPLLGLLFIIKFKLPQLFGLLLLMELAMPPATSLSLIIRNYQKDDLFISQAIFVGHILSLISIPLFLIFYFALGTKL